MNIRLVLLIVLLFAGGGFGFRYSPYLGGGFGVVAVILIVLLVMGLL